MILARRTQTRTNASASAPRCSREVGWLSFPICVGRDACHRVGLAAWTPTWDGRQRPDFINRRARRMEMFLLFPTVERELSAGRWVCSTPAPGEGGVGGSPSSLGAILAGWQTQRDGLTSFRFIRKAECSKWQPDVTVWKCFQVVTDCPDKEPALSFLKSFIHTQQITHTHKESRELPAFWEHK